MPNRWVRTKVNDMLAFGASYAGILRALAEDNAKLDKRDQVTIDSIRNHTARHFPSSRPLTPPTATSWSAGLGRTVWTLSRGWRPRSHRWPTSRW